MSYHPDLIAEINLLGLFNPATTQAGIKVHQDAAPEMIEAAKRLFNKGLITQDDGGYLTDLGLDALEHWQNLLTILTTPAQLDTLS